jgi:hypothetical protein
MLSLMSAMKDQRCLASLTDIKAQEQNWSRRLVTATGGSGEQTA